MEIKYTISEDNALRLVDAICGLFDYKETISNPNLTDKNPLPDIENPETKAMFTKRMVKEYMINQTRRWEEVKAKRQINLNADININ